MRRHGHAITAMLVFSFRGHCFIAIKHGGGAMFQHGHTINPNWLKESMYHGCPTALRGDELFASNVGQLFVLDYYHVRTGFSCLLVLSQYTFQDDHLKTSESNSVQKSKRANIFSTREIHSCMRLYRRLRSHERATSYATYISQQGRYHFLVFINPYWG